MQIKTQGIIVKNLKIRDNLLDEVEGWTLNIERRKIGQRIRISLYIQGEFHKFYIFFLMKENDTMNYKNDLRITN